MRIFRVGSIAIRVCGQFSVGDGLPPHAHNFDHASLSVQGRHLVRLRTPGGKVTEKLIEPGQFLNVPAADIHSSEMLPNSLDPHVRNFREAVEDYVSGKVSKEYLAASLRLFDQCQDALPGLIYCIYNHRDDRGQPTDDYAGNSLAYEAAL